MNAITHIPQLVFGKNRHGNDCWKLYNRQTVGKEEFSVCLEIRYYFGDDEGPNHYTMLGATDLDGYGYRELMTIEEMVARCESIADHENEEAAKDWEQNKMDHYYILWGPAVGNGILKTMCDELIVRWEAMLALNLFQPHVTY